MGNGIIGYDKPSSATKLKHLKVGDMVSLTPRAIKELRVRNNREACEGVVEAIFQSGDPQVTCDYVEYLDKQGKRQGFGSCWLEQGEMTDNKWNVTR